MGESGHSTIGQLNRRLAEFGMEVLGSFRPEPGEASLEGSNLDNLTGLMIASFGQKMWPVFIASQQFNDGKPDPLDRWSGQVLGNVAVEFGASLRLPFERPYPPFQKWAKRTGQVEASPLGILIHPEYGLWFGLRGVLFVATKGENQALESLTKEPHKLLDICGKCTEKPCLSTCPVKAFGDDGLQVQACFAHLAGVEKSATSVNCMQLGCAARSACPVAGDHRYDGRQLQFHMDAFYRNSA